MIEQLFDRQDGLDILRLLIAAASLIAAIVYLRFVGGASSPLRATVKTMVIGVLVFLPLTYANVEFADTRTLLILAVALLLSALGDLFLALRRQDRFFLFGLGSFLAAHVTYLLIFIPRATWPGGFTAALIAGLLGAASALIVWLNPGLGKLRPPVFAYFAVIMAMVAASLSIPDAPWFLGAGAVLFAVSDSLIAVRKFKQPFPYIDVAVWVTYCAAQYLIVAGLLVMLVHAGVPA